MTRRRRAVVLGIAVCASAAGVARSALPQAQPDKVQPTGAPGLTPAQLAQMNGGVPPYTKADVHFMSGMIGHHAQAVLMAGWAPSHGASASVHALCERIVVGQRDEIAFMQRWLGEHHEPVPPADPRGQIMPGMDHPMLMPGMLTPEQMAQLDAARGPEFDRLFLTFMIQHHQGAITMVNQLFSAQGAAQDGSVFRFASDVTTDQTTEIDRMTRMLAVRSSTGKDP